MISVPITKDEQSAIKALQRLAKKWPDTLGLFSWSGSLCVVKTPAEEVGKLRSKTVVVESVMGIRNDGGDPSSDEMYFDHEVEIVFE